MSLDVGIGPSPGELSASQFNLTHSIAESIAEGFDIGIHTTKHDFDNHLKIGIFEGVDPSDSLAELTEKTATHD